MKSFEFATAGRIIFGAGRLELLPSLVQPYGERVFVVTGSSVDRAEKVFQLICDAGCQHADHQVSSEPTISAVEEGAVKAREWGADVVVGFGGGSVIDAAKAIAALVPNTEPALSYLEVVGDGKPLKKNPIPYIAIPTTSGTGAEVTKNAVLHSKEHRVKVSLRSPMMFPDVALIDPRNTLSVPPDVTATTGMDALTQLIEPFVSCRANTVTDAVCREAIPLIVRSLENAFRDGSNLEAREDMAFASMASGMALANSGLGAVHGFAAPIGGMFSVAHGAVCAALLPSVLRMNLVRLKSQAGTADGMDRFAELARLLTGSDGAQPTDAVQWVTDLNERLGIEGLASLGIQQKDFSQIAEKATAASSMKGNPVKLSQSELIEVLAEG